MGPCVVLAAFSEGVKWDLGPIFQLPWGKGFGQGGAPWYGFTEAYMKYSHNVLQ